MNHINTNRLEVKDVNHMEILQEEKYFNFQPQEINKVIPHMQTVDDVITPTLDVNDIDSFLETVYNTNSYNKVDMHEPNDISSYPQQETNIMSHIQDVNYSMELEDTSVQVGEVNENIPHPQESNHASSILQEAMEISVNEVENTYNAQNQNYHYTFSFEDMEEVSASM